MTSYPRPKDSWGGVREGTKSFAIKIYLKDSKGGVREGTKFKKFFLPSASRAALDRDNAFGVILSLRVASECLKIDVSERPKSPKLKNIKKCRVYSFLPTAECNNHSISLSQSHPSKQILHQQNVQQKSEIRRVLSM